MPTFMLVGIPALIIAVLGGLVVWERHHESADEQRRISNLKRWLVSQVPPH